MKSIRGNLERAYPALCNFLRLFALTLDTPQLAMVVRLAAERPGVINYGGLSKQILRAMINHQPLEMAVSADGALSLHSTHFRENGSQDDIPLLLGQLQAADHSYDLTIYGPGISQARLTSKQTALLHTFSQQLVLYLKLMPTYSPSCRQTVGAVSHAPGQENGIRRCLPAPLRQQAVYLPPSQTTLLDSFGTQLQSCLLEKQLNKLLADYLPPCFPDRAGRLVLMDNTNDFKVITQWGNYDHIIDLEMECSFTVERLLKSSLEDYLRCHNCAAHKTEADPYICIVLGVFEKTAYVLQLFQTTDQPLSYDQIVLLKTLSEQLPPVMQRLHLLKALSTKAFEDPLTGLQNRRYLEKTLSYLCQNTASSFEISVILVDIDYFKSINDTYGHPAGDAVLKDFSILLKGHVRSKDIVCRYGGEEFCIVLLDTPPDVAMERAEKIRRAVKYLTTVFDGQPLKSMSISLGVASFPHHGQTPEELITKADKALYWAKNHGRDQSVRIDQIPPGAEQPS